MNDQENAREQLLAENAALRKRVAALAAQLARSQQAEADQRRINNRLPVLVGTAGLDGYYKEVNAAFERILGWSADESFSRPFLEFVHPEDRTASIETFARLKAGTPAVNFLNRNICKNGSYRWINWTVIPVPDRAIIFGIGQDITERKQAEETVRQSEQWMRFHVEQTPLAVIEWDLDLRVAKWNPGAQRIFGYTAQQAVGRHFAFLVPPSAAGPVDQVWNGLRVKKGGERSTNENVTKDGRSVLCEWYNTPLVNAAGQVVGFASLAEDITDRKRAEQALLESEERYRLLAEAIPHPVWRWSAEQGLIECSRRWYEYTGQTPDEARGKGWMKALHPDDRTRISEEIRGRQDAAGSDVHRVEYRVRRAADGSYRWQLSQSVPRRDARGRIIDWFGSITDIDDRKRAEEELEQRVRERTAELTTANERLQAEVQERQRAEEALRESEQRMQMALEVSRSFAFEWEPATDRVLRSDSCSQVLGLAGDEALHDTGQRFFQRIQREDRDRFVQMLGALRPTANTYRAEYRATRGDGTTVVLEESARGFFDSAGMLCRLVGATTDITERRRVEAELRASKERFELVVRAAGAGVFDWDLRTGKVYYSPRWKSLFGYAEHEIGERFEDWASRLHPSERDRIVRLHDEFLAGTSPTAIAEYRLRHKDGSYRWVIAHVLAVRDTQGKACRLVGSHVDITARKLAEEKVKAEQQALRRMILANDQERRLITYELHDGVAQQLLGAKMLFESCQPGRKSQTAMAWRDGMEALTQAATELRRVMNWLRTPVLEQFGLVEAIADVASQLRLRPDAPKIECCPAVQFKRLEPTLENTLFRIAQEAMNNACRHSKSEKVRVKLTQQGDEVTLEVRDWGIGFDQEAVHENRFGLEGIRERARILGGRLRIKSKPGAGTVVRAQFPVIEAVAEE